MRVRAFATLRDMLGTSEIRIDNEGKIPVRQVLRSLVAEYPVISNKLWSDEEKLTGRITILLNGRALEYLNGLDTEAGPDDTLSLFPPVGGG